MIQRHIRSKINHRVVEHSGVLYLGGVVADDKTLDMKGQTQQVCSKIEALLTQFGSSKRKILTATIFLSDFSGKDAMNEAWLEWLAPDDLPTRTTVGVQLVKGTLVEIVVSAAK
ncbi:RidA family protein [Chelativorans sp. AA-79]|uniref:RidA family protein n=1 Tax=Chelativorans sp. AA-79 TaxID=3028735 RepID=UPI0023F7FFA1|nr:RidA family protein [Chelativorans sp. AA-79]WEX08273.1 RidA family protein [Chelativorans sp. AA-79]